MAKKKMTVLDFKKYMQEGRRFTCVTAYDYTTASIVNDSDTDIILVGDSLGMTMLGYNTTVGVTMEDMIHHIRPVVKGAPDTFIMGDMPFGSYQEGPQQAIRNACRMLAETNCDCIKLEGGGSVAPTIRALVDVGIPVCAHIGLTPQSATSVGGFQVQGGTPEGAKKLILDAKAVEAAGAFAMVLECVPSVVAQAVQAAISIPVLGIGAGPELPCQVLIFHDMMDMYGDFKPKFVKQFAHIRAEMVGALNAFHTETADGAFPTPEFSFNKQVEIPPLED